MGHCGSQIENPCRSKGSLDKDKRPIDRVLEPSRRSRLGSSITAIRSIDLVKETGRGRDQIR